MHALFVAALLFTGAPTRLAQKPARAPSVQLVTTAGALSALAAQVRTTLQVGPIDLLRANVVGALADEIDRH
ncbi:MAG: hypothetical protein ACHQ17_00910 [Polyangia bacterium]